ncbi:hypothetical protein Tco_1260864 [Tanacetum coccineum]
MDITSDHKPGSAGRTSIIPDSVHAGGWGLRFALHAYNVVDHLTTTGITTIPSERRTTTTLVEEIAATDWGDESSDDENTPGKVTILDESSNWDDDERSGGKILVLREELSQNQQDFLDEYLPQWDDQLATQKQRSESEWENPFTAKRGKGNTFSGGYGEYHNSQWTLPPAWTESGVILVRPVDPGLWSEVISIWESITINRLNNQMWSDNKAKLAFVKNLMLGF